MVVVVVGGFLVGGVLGGSGFDCVRSLGMLVVRYVVVSKWDESVFICC